MFRPSHDPSDPPLIEEPTWRGILVSYGFVATIPLLLWVISHPLTATVTLAGITALIFGGKHAYKLRRCFYHCQEFTFQVGETAQITVTQLPGDNAN